MPKLTPDALNMLPRWREKKQTQWERAAAILSPIHLVKYGTHQSTYMLVRSTSELYEGIIFGRLPKQRIKPQRGNRPPSVELVEALIDLTDEQIDAVLELWKRNRSALELEFIEAVYDRTGRRITR